MDDLTLSGLVLPQNVQAICLLASLPSSWQSFITTQTMQVNLTISLLIPAILQEHAMRNSLTQPTSSSSTLAMYANQKPRINPKGYKQNTFQYHPHTKSRPSKRLQKPFHNQNFRLLKLHCGICGKSHNTRDCWRNPSKKGRSNSRYANYDSDSGSQASTTPDDVDQQSVASDDSSGEDAYLAFSATHTYSDGYNSTSPFDIRFGDNGVQKAIGVGQATIELSDGNMVNIDQVYYVPSIAKNFISVSKVTSRNTSIEFYHSHCTIHHLLPTGRRYFCHLPENWTTILFRSYSYPCSGSLFRQSQFDPS